MIPRQAIVLSFAMMLACAAEPVQPLPRPDLTGAEEPVVEAIRRAEQAVRDDPRSAAAWGALGARYASHGFTDEAIECYANAERLDPRRVDWPYLVGHHETGRDLAAAAAAFARAAELDPAYAPARYRLARTLHLLGRPDEAERAYREALDLDPAFSHAMVGLAQLAVDRGDDAEAEQLFRGALSIREAHVDAHHGLARLLRGSGDPTGAEHHARRAAELADRSPELDDPLLDRGVAPAGSLALNTFGMGLERDGNLEGAARAFEAAIAANSERAEIWYNLGKVRAKQGRSAAAIEAFRRSLAIDPDYIASHQLIGTELGRLGRHAEAIVHLERVVRDWPELAAARVNLGLAYAGSGRHEDALAALDAAAGLAPDDAEIPYNRGVLLAGLGRLAEAREAFLLARRLDPSDPDAADALRALDAAPGR